MIKSNGRYVVGEDEVVYGEDMDMVDKAMETTINFPVEV